MAIQIKRTEGIAQQERDEDWLRKEHMKALAHEQQAGLREELQESLHKLGAGIQRWEDAGWEWQPFVDAAADNPAEWTGLARVMYRLAQVIIIERQLSWLTIREDQPYWCPGCHPGEQRPSDYTDEDCPVHNHASSLAISTGITVFGHEGARK